TKADITPLKEREEKFKREFASLKKGQKDMSQVVDWMNDRYYWADVLTELRRVLIKVEDSTKGRLHTDAGVWIEKLDAAPPMAESEATSQPVPPPSGRASAADQEVLRRRYGIDTPRSAEAPQQQP